jgi:Outer membrane protein beta-barrel domain
MVYHDAKNLCRLLGACLAVLFSAAAAVQAQEPRWSFRLLGYGSDITRHDEDDRYSIFHVDLSGRWGGGLSVEGRTGRRLGAELSGLWLKVDLKTTEASLPPSPPFRSVETRNETLRLVTLGLPIHLTPDRHPDVSLGPIGGSVRYAGSRYVGPRSHYAYGLALGVDWPLAHREWAIAGTARYLYADVGESAFYKRWLPLRLFGLGISYRR